MMPQGPNQPDSIDRMPAPAKPHWRHRVHEVIFEADTPAGKAFDVALLVVILLSVLVVMLDSVTSIHQRYGGLLYGIEWLFTVLFTIEYVLRLSCVKRPGRYAVSFFGVVDLLAILPTYLSVLIPGAQSLVVIRSLRLLRVFRIFKLARMLTEASGLWRALRASRAKIAVFMFAVVVIVTIMGSAMHLVEGPRNGEAGNPGFASIPQSMYWAIVTMTTVGYGDATPQTTLGKTIAAMVMVLGYSLIIVPTGIVSAELAQQYGKQISTQACPSCGRGGHEIDARFCKYCAARL